MDEYPKTLFKNGKFDGEQKEVKTNGEEAQARTLGFTDRYVHVDYPKSMHLMGDRTQAERVVADKAAEDAARAEGFYTIHEVESGEVEPEMPAKKEPATAVAKKANKKGATE